MLFKRLDIVEKKTYGYQERDELQREAFKERLKTTLPHQLVYVDEAGTDNREDYAYGYCEVGERFHALKSGKRTERVSWIAALRQKNIFAPMTFNGTCNRDLFEMWLEDCLLPQLKAGDIIIIDNASFHSSQAIDDMVEAADVKSGIYLPILQTSTRLKIGGSYSRIG